MVADNHMPVRFFTFNFLFLSLLSLCYTDRVLFHIYRNIVENCFVADRLATWDLYAHTIDLDPLLIRGKHEARSNNVRTIIDIYISCVCESPHKDHSNIILLLLLLLMEEIYFFLLFCSLSSENVVLCACERMNKQTKKICIGKNENSD